MVPGEGPKPCDGMIVGMNPGKEEVDQGRPFVGASGQLLEMALGSLGYSREEFYITNVYKEGTPDNREPTWEEVLAHTDFLLEELDEVRPKAVLALGNVACEFFLGERGITKLRGSWGGMALYPTMPTFHPSFILRTGGSGMGTYNVWVDDIAKWLDFLQKGTNE